jgi:trans-2,3-dihydro-3-hydroxyanthranilate isomerase
MEPHGLLTRLWDQLQGVPQSSGRYVVLDVFTEHRWQGNQLAVFVDGASYTTTEMQQVARELNLSETVFLLAGSGRLDVNIRIFTPSVELPFAGHPVLGAGVLTGWALNRTRVTIGTSAGAIPMELVQHPGWVCSARMRQPLPTFEPFPAERQLLDALGVDRSGLPLELYCNGPRYVYVELEDEAAVAALRPDMARLADLGSIGVSCFAKVGARFKVRVFAPAAGIAEDPATGSAAGPLALHLARHGRTQFGEEIEIVQGEELGRPSMLQARAVGSADSLEAIEVAGSAVLAAVGSLIHADASQTSG